MNSKERVATVLAGGLPDRVPLADWAVDHDTVERLLGRPTYLRNKAACQIAFWEGRHAEVAESWIRDTIDLHRVLPFDIVTFPMASWRIPEPSAEPPPRQIGEGAWEDRQGRVYKYTAAADDILCVRDPAAEARLWTETDFQGPTPEPRPFNAASQRVLDAIIGELGRDKFIAGPGGSEVGMVLPGGLARGCELIAERPEVVEAAVARTLAQADADDAVQIHPGQDAVLWGDDFGHKTGTFVSPRMFRRHFLPANRHRVERLHARGLPVLKHCCGNLNGILDQFLEIGYDAYQSIQPTAGMDITEVKRRIGDRITLWGGVGVEKLISGTPDQVRADARRALAACKPGGRFILGSSHSIAVGTRFENFQALLDAWTRDRDYPSAR